MAPRLYDLNASLLEVPGLEAVLEYNGVRINDRSLLERARLTSIAGLSDDPDIRETRESNADRHGERVGIQLMGGRTITMEGLIEAGSIPMVRDTWRRYKRAFDGVERDMVLRVPREVMIYRNEIDNPSLDNGFATGWSMVTTAGGTGLCSSVADGGRFIGRCEDIGATATAGTVSAVYDQTLMDSTWSGHDVWVRAMIRNFVSSGVTSKIDLNARCYDASNSLLSTITVATQNSPVLGTNYDLSGRILSTAIPAGTVKVSVAIVGTHAATAGTYTIKYWDVAVVYVKPTDPSPDGYFDGSMPGFDWVDMPQGSPSIGPSTQVNGVRDTLTKDGTLWENGSDAGATLNSGPTAVKIANITDSTSAIYIKLTNPDGTTRVMALRQIRAAASDRLSVTTGRMYRATATVKAVQNAGKVAAISIVFLDNSGTVVGTTTANGTASLAEQILTVTATAPANANYAFMQTQYTANGAAQAFEWYTAKPSIIDISDYDPGSLIDFRQDNGKNVVRLANSSNADAGSIRRVPRPFLIKKVRKTAAVSAPEQQKNLKSERDFMLSLRASDPRIYAYDPHTKWIRFAGAVNYVSDSIYDSAVGIGFDTVVPGYTFIVDESSADLNWFDTTLGGSSWFALSNGNSITPVKEARRVFRSLEGFTYAQPFGILQGNTIGTQYASGTDFIKPKDNSIEIVIKRITNTNYLIVRWTGSIASPNGTLELVKIVAGTPTILKTVNVPQRVYPPNSWLLAYMSGNTVNYGIYATYPTMSNLPNAVISDSFTLAGGDATTYGSAVSGATGWGMATKFTGTLSNQTGQTPRVDRFETGSYTDYIGATPIIIPMTGDFDQVQPIFKFTGIVVNPLVQIQTPDGAIRNMSLKGTFTNVDPATMDLDAGTFEGISGLDRWDTFQAFSDDLVLNPGTNIMRAFATSWDLSSATNSHVGVSWRDALR